jgi:hypothetical protein
MSHFREKAQDRPQPKQHVMTAPCRIPMHCQGLVDVAGLEQLQNVLREMAREENWAQGYSAGVPLVKRTHVEHLHMILATASTSED